jgi:hypothetical protein
VSTLNPRLTISANQRRSQRILLSVPLEVSGKRADGAAFQETAATVAVNAHGALALLRERVQLEQVLLVKNMATSEKVACVVKDLNDGENGTFEVGLEFSEPRPRFWRVAFPPTDWNSRGPEAKRFTLPAVAHEKPVK